MDVNILRLTVMVFCEILFCKCYLVLLPETSVVVRQGQSLELTCQSNVSGGTYWFYSYDDAGNVVSYGMGGDEKKTCINSSDQVSLVCEFEGSWRFRLTLLHPAHNQVIYCRRYLNQKATTRNTTIFLQVPVTVSMTVVSEVVIDVGKLILSVCRTNYCNPPANITWYKGNSVISNSSMLTSTYNTSSQGLVRTESSLSITIFEDDDCQELYCTANNLEEESVESERSKIKFLALPPINISAICDVTSAWIFWKTMESPPSLTFPPQQSMTLQLSTVVSGYVNATNDVIAMDFGDVQIYKATNLQPNTEYWFRIVTFDCFDEISSENLTCHTQQIIDQKNVNICDRERIIGVSLGGAVLGFFVLIGGFNLVKCIQKRRCMRHTVKENWTYVDSLTSSGYYKYQEFPTTPNTAFEKINEAGEYLELPDKYVKIEDTPENSVKSFNKANERAECLDKDHPKSCSDNSLRTSDMEFERGEYLELPNAHGTF